MEFTKNILNTTGDLEFFVLNKLYDIPIIILNKYNEIIKVFDKGKIILEKFTNYSFKNSIKIKHFTTSEVKLPIKIYSIY